MKQYKAIKELVIGIVDGDGFTVFEQSDEEGWACAKEEIIPVGSIWELEEESKWRMCGGEIRLLDVDGSALGWIEIDKETFDEYFEEVKK